MSSLGWRILLLFACPRWSSRVSGAPWNSDPVAMLGAPGLITFKSPCGTELDTESDYLYHSSLINWITQYLRNMDLSSGCLFFILFIFLRFCMVLLFIGWGALIDSKSLDHESQSISWVAMGSATRGCRYPNLAGSLSIGHWPRHCAVDYNDGDYHGGDCNDGDYNDGDKRKVWEYTAALGVGARQSPSSQLTELKLYRSSQLMELKLYRSSQLTELKLYLSS